MSILVVPNSLRELSREIRRANYDLEDISNRLGGIVGSLDWEVRQRTDVEGYVNSARARAYSLTEEGERLAGILEAKAQAFEEADRAGVVALQHLGASFASEWARQPLPSLGFRSLPDMPHLGPFFGATIIGGTLLPIVGKVAGTARLMSWEGAHASIRDFGERLWNWLRGKGWEPGAEPQGASANRPVQEGALSPTSAPRDRGAPSPSPDGAGPQAQPRAGQPTQEAAPQAPARHDQWWLDVPIASQQGLKTADGKTTQWGCAPTSASMILDYWHNMDAQNKTATPQALISDNIVDGAFQPVGGMSPADLEDEVKDLGYKTFEVAPDATAEALREAVAQGPVMAVVKLHMKEAGATHAVVVTGIAQDGKTVRINDPWDARSYELPWEEFDKTWGADFGKDPKGSSYPTHIIVAIRP